MYFCTVQKGDIAVHKIRDQIKINMKEKVAGRSSRVKRLRGQQIPEWLDHAALSVSELDIKVLVPSVLLVGIL